MVVVLEHVCISRADLVAGFLDRTVDNDQGDTPDGVVIETIIPTYM